MSEVRFRNVVHRDFFLENTMKCKINDCYHRTFLYAMGTVEETRKNIDSMFNLKTDHTEPERMYAGWQTSDTVKVCNFVFNFRNGYTEEGCEKYSTPEELFCCEFAPRFMEGIKVRYLEYCRDLPASKKQTEHTR